MAINIDDYDKILDWIDANITTDDYDEDIKEQEYIEQLIEDKLLCPYCGSQDIEALDDKISICKECLEYL